MATKDNIAEDYRFVFKIILRILHLFKSRAFPKSVTFYSSSLLGTPRDSFRTK